MTSLLKDGYSGSQWEVFAYTNKHGMRSKALRVLFASEEAGAVKAYWYYISLVDYQGLQQTALMKLHNLEETLYWSAIAAIGPESRRSAAINALISRPGMYWTTIAMTNYKNMRDTAIFELNSLHELLYWRAIGLIDYKGLGDEALLFKLPELDKKYEITI